MSLTRYRIGEEAGTPTVTVVASGRGAPDSTSVMATLISSVLFGVVRFPGWRARVNVGRDV